MTEKNDENQKNEDIELWEHITQGIKPLKDHQKSKHHEKQKTEKIQKTKTPQTEKTIPQSAEPPISRELDHRTAKRLKRGQIRPEARLDLHGMTQIQAHDALQGFILHNTHKRCLLIITGKGTARNSAQEHKPGILKQKVPEWLNEPPLNQHVLKTQTAHIKDGGEGALYVYLRRQRT